jgi:hypothetical protein
MLGFISFSANLQYRDQPRNELIDLLLRGKHTVRAVGARILFAHVT